MSNLISFVVPVFNIAPIYLIKCIESVRSQRDPNWELILCDDCSANSETLSCLESYRGLDPRIKVINKTSNEGIAMATNVAIEFTVGEFVAFLDNDDEISLDAVAEVRHYLNLHPTTDLLYTDEDKIDENGLFCDTYHKPDFSPEHLYSSMYILHLTVIRKEFLLKLGMLRSEFDGAQDYDLVLRAAKTARHVGHIAKILYHWRKIPGSAAAVVDAKPQALINAARSLADVTGCNVDGGLLYGLFRIRPNIDPAPPVTILIPTNNVSKYIEGRGNINLLINLLTSIKNKTTYPNFRIIIFDNCNIASSDADIIKSLELDVVISSYSSRCDTFNFSHKFNALWRLAETDLVILLNDDMEIISPGWIEALVEPMQDPKVGIVGARLLHADETIQHVGIVFGIYNGAAHIYHGHPSDRVGYNGFTHLIRNYSAVTGACLITRKSILQVLDGFDECFAVDFNDADFCLRTQQLDYRVVYTPHCELYHFESQTCERLESNPIEAEMFRTKWATVIKNDPYYNENLPKDRHDFFG